MNSVNLIITGPITPNIDYVNNKILKSLVVNNDKNIHSDKVIHHFPGGPGVYHHKIVIMTNFLNNIKDFTIIDNINKAKA